jgi:serine phosphatase RsbU (regulator of sigma subunit)/CHASE3 domain sensor protein
VPVNLRPRLAIMAGALIVSLVSIGAVGVGLSIARNDAAKSERDLSVGVQQVLRLVSAYTDMETGERGFIIGGSEVFLEPYERGATLVDDLQKALREGVSANDRSTLEALNVSMAAGTAWREQAKQEIALRRSRGRQASEAEVATQVGKERFDRLRASLDGLTERLVDRLRESSRQRERQAQRLTKLLYAVPVAGLIFTAFAAVAISRWVGRPMARMLASVRAISAGDLSSNVEVGGAPDVAEVGATIDAMRITIAERLHDSERLREISDRAREALEQSTTVTLQLRSELANELGSFPPGWTAAANLLPAQGWVAGDCYDVTLVAPHLLGIIVIDIAGHGAPQAIVALRCKEILRAALRMHLDPGAALGLLAEQVGDLYPSFVTAFVAIVDTASGACRYANAGHPAALLAGHDNVVHELAPTGPLLGVFDGSWSTATALVTPGAKLAVYTDGLTEARNHAEEFYGMERLASLVVTLPCEIAESVIKACFDDLHVFRPARMSDDVTMVLVCRECEAS